MTCSPSLRVPFCRPRLFFGLIVLALIFFSATPLFPAFGAATATDKAQPEGKALLRLIDPSRWRLSPEAEHLYYYLLLSQGLADNSQTVISFALKGLLKLDPTLEVFQDGATILLARGEYAAAESTAKDGLRRFPDDPLLVLLLSGAYSESDRPLLAIRLLEDHLKKKPDAADIAEELVRLYIREGQDEKVADFLGRMPQPKDDPQSELFRAGVLSTVGRNDEAKKLLRDMVTKDPRFIEAWLELAYIAEREGKNDEALEAYDKASAIMPDNPEIWFRVAMVHLEAKRPEEALRSLEKVPPSGPMFMQAAMRFASARRYAEAEDLLGKAAASGAGKDECALLLSMMKQEASKDPKDGLPPLADIPSDSPLYPAALEQKARIHMMAKEYDKALREAGEARRRYPERKELWGLEAYALVKLNKTREAEALLKEALKQTPDDEDLLFSLGSVQDQIDKKGAAMKTMERLIALNPRNHQALNYIGYSLADAGKELQRALKLISAAHELQPDADYIVDSLAWVQYRLGRFGEAWQNINRCLELGGDDPTIWEHYGDIALALGKKSEAAKGYNEAIARKADNLADLQKKLRKLGK
ncbi:MAG: tetratricopeptide repeat protein [Desulfovibrio sp.]|jgi:tetratricopeptide (TPR) repeat protein|nr:tetratricopeptide repeat protein [Desulfovibrio sp.]